MKPMSDPCLELTLTDSSATESLGLALASAFPGAGRGAAVLFLHGELGAGKTSCARSLLQGLGVQGKVRSPTYTLVDAYVLEGLTCVHVDLYRVQSLTEVDELGLRDYAGPGHLLLIEWAEKGMGVLPPADLDLTLRYSGAGRCAHAEAKTRLGKQWLANLARNSSLSPYVSNLT